VIAAPDRKTLITRTRALDGVLLWGHYVIPHWHIQAYRVAFWNKFSRPAVTPKYALGFGFWWVDPEKEAVLMAEKGAAVEADIATMEDGAVETEAKEEGFNAGELWLSITAIAVIAFLMQWLRARRRRDDDE